MAEIGAEGQDLLRAYRLFFSTNEGRTIMSDLMKFCRFRSDVTSDVDEGMRRVFLRVLNFSQLTDEQIIALYAGRPIGDEK